MITYAKGDIFATEVDAYAHGCNCVGKMGAGIAVEFRKRWPDMYQDYARLCDEGHLSPGDVFGWLNTRPRVFNLMTQPGVRYGQGATVEAIETSMKEMFWLARAEGIKSIAMPIIGCGLGGLDWETQVKPVVNKFYNEEVDLYVAVEYVPGQSLINPLDELTRLTEEYGGYDVPDS